MSGEILVPEAWVPTNHRDLNINAVFMHLLHRNAAVYQRNCEVREIYVFHGNWGFRYRACQNEIYILYLSSLIGYFSL